MKKQSQIILTLCVLCAVDLVIPIPILGLVLIYVVLEKPTWFRKLVQEVYGG